MSVVPSPECQVINGTRRLKVTTVLVALSRLQLYCRNSSPPKQIIFPLNSFTQLQFTLVTSILKSSIPCQYHH